MLEHKNKQEPSKGLSGLIKNLAIAIFAISFIQWLNQGPDMRHFLIDTDSYVRLIRVHHFWETGQWYNNHLPYINAPYGIDIHWTKLLDGLLMVSAFALKPFMEFKEALFYGSFLWNPLFLFLSTAALAWGIYPYVRRLSALVCALVLAAHPVIQIYALPNRIDHHILQVFLFCLLIGVYLRLWCSSPLKNSARSLGIIAAIGVWVSFEFLLAVAWLFTVFWIQWLNEEDTQIERLIQRVSLWFFGALLLLLPLERGGDSLVFQDIQRLSLFHVFLGGVLILGLYGLFHPRNKAFIPSKFVRSGLTAIILGGFFFLILDKFHVSLDFVDPRIRTIWFNNISEIIPLYSNGIIYWDNLPYYSLILWGIFGLWRAWKTSVCPPPVFMATIIGFTFFSLTTFYQFREMLYLAPFLALSYALWARSITSRKGSDSPWLIGLKLFGIMGLGQFSYLAGWGVLKMIPMVETPRLEKNINTSHVFIDVQDQQSPLIRFLNDPQGLGATSKIIFCLPDLEAAALLWYTPHRVVYAPYHDNVEGILDRHTLRVAPLAKAKAMIDKRGVDYILLRRIDIRSQETLEPGTLYWYLTYNLLPEWLTAVQLPEKTQEQYVLLKVKKTHSNGTISGTP